MSTIANVSVDAHVIDALMRDLVGHDKSASAYLVYLFLWSHAAESRAHSVSMSHAAIAEATGISKSGVQAAIRHLNRRRLVRSEHASQTATPEHFVLRPWIRR